MKTIIKRRLTFAGWLLGLWTTVAVLFAMQGYTYDSLHGHTWPTFEYFRWAMEEWYTWALFSPAVLWLAAKRPIDPRRLSRSLPPHFAASVLIAVLVVFFQAILSHLFNTDKGPVLDYIRLYLSKYVALNIATYWALIGCAQTLAFYRETNNRRLRESQLERQLAQAQLQVLQMQLHPHFLFNTLHAIGTLVQEDPDAAEQMLLDLASLLRVFLEQSPSQQISLRRELSLVDRYLNIQKTRFKDRLTINCHAHPDTLDGSVPSLILQPIVENAIVHGIAKNPGNDVIEIRSRWQQARLLIEVSNSNSTLPDNVRPDGTGWGIGLSNTEQRLTQMYNGIATFSIQARSPRGVVCRILMPFERRQPESSEVEALLSL